MIRVFGKREQDDSVVPAIGDPSSSHSYWWCYDTESMRAWWATSTGEKNDDSGYSLNTYIGMHNTVEVDPATIGLAMPEHMRVSEGL